MTFSSSWSVKQRLPLELVFLKNLLIFWNVIDWLINDSFKLAGDEFDLIFFFMFELTKPFGWFSGGIMLICIWLLILLSFFFFL